MKKFTKDDIKPGMVVEFMNGDMALVAKHHKSHDNWLLIDRKGLIDYSSGFNDDLTNLLRNEDGTSQWDIATVYDTYQLGCRFLVDGLVPIWERKEPKEHTMEELTEILGYEFKIKK